MRANAPMERDWSPPLSENRDMCMFYSENGIQACAPVDPDGSLPVLDVTDSPLLWRQPCFARAGKYVFKIAEDGFYRFHVFPDTVANHILYTTNTPRFVGSVGELHLHGWRDNDMEPADLLVKAKDRFISITCGFIARVAMELFSQQGIETRAVGAATLERWNTYDCGHALFEYRDPLENRWILADSDMGVVFKAEGNLLDVDMVCRFTRQGKQIEYVRVNNGPRLDFCTDHVERQTAFYAMYMASLSNWDRTVQWFRRIMQIPRIEGCFTADTQEEKERYEALCSTTNAKVQYLSPEAFRERFYE